VEHPATRRIEIRLGQLQESVVALRSALSDAERDGYYVGGVVEEACDHTLYVVAQLVLEAAGTAHGIRVLRALATVAALDAWLTRLSAQDTNRPTTETAG
jgi:hypothetical protein